MMSSASNGTPLIPPSLAQLLNPPSANTTTVTMHLQNLQNKYAQLVSIPTQPVHTTAAKVDDHTRANQTNHRNPNGHMTNSVAAAAAAAAVAAVANHHHHHHSLNTVDYSALTHPYANAHSIHTHPIVHSHALPPNATHSHTHPSHLHTNASLSASSLHSHHTTPNTTLTSLTHSSPHPSHVLAATALPTPATAVTTAKSVTDATTIQMRPGSYGIRHLTNISPAASTIKLKKMACGACRKAKSSCDGERPCFRCIRLKRTDTCCDPTKEDKEELKEKHSKEEKKEKTPASNKKRKSTTSQSNDSIEAEPTHHGHGNSNGQPNADDVHSEHSLESQSSKYQKVASLSPLLKSLSSSKFNTPEAAVIMLQNTLLSVFEAFPETMDMLPKALEKATEEAKKALAARAEGQISSKPGEETTTSASNSTTLTSSATTTTTTTTTSSQSSSSLSATTSTSSSSTNSKTQTRTKDEHSNEPVYSPSTDAPSPCTSTSPESPSLSSLDDANEVPLIPSDVELTPLPTMEAGPSDMTIISRVLADHHIKSGFINDVKNFKTLGYHHSKVHMFLLHMTEVMEECDFLGMMHSPPSGLVPILNPKVDITAEQVKDHPIWRRKTSRVMWYDWSVSPQTIATDDSTPYPASALFVCKLTPEGIIQMRKAMQARLMTDEEAEKFLQESNQSHEFKANDTETTQVHAFWCDVHKKDKANADVDMKASEEKDNTESSSSATANQVASSSTPCSCSRSIRIPMEIRASTQFTRLFGMTQAQLRELFMERGCRATFDLIKQEYAIKVGGLMCSSQYVALMQPRCEFRTLVNTKHFTSHRLFKCIHHVKSSIEEPYDMVLSWTQAFIPVPLEDAQEEAKK